MKVTVVSNNINIKAEFEEKLNASFDLISKDTMLSHISKANTDIVFCVDLKVPVKKLVNLQQKQPELLIVFNAVVVTLEELVKKGLSPDRIIGMNLLPTFINRSLAEITLDKNTPASISTIEELGWEVKKIERPTTIPLTTSWKK